MKSYNVEKNKLRSKYRKFKKHETSYILQKTLVVSIICSKCKNEDETIFKEEKSIEILKFLDFIEKT